MIQQEMHFKREKGRRKRTTDTHLRAKDTNRFKMKEWEMTFHANNN
jgi:hypothetical protein